MPVTKEWFNTWFDSPYYHILYHDRDEKEASFFLENLFAKINIIPGGLVLDLACGKGRHSLILHQKGFDVTGIDFSEKNIAYAQKSEEAGLSFFKHDMRDPFRVNYFDVVLNLFTSFGYFKTKNENEKVMRNVVMMLRPGGLFVLDFMNVKVALKKMTGEETKKISGIDFHIVRSAAEGMIRKEIRFTDRGCSYDFTEEVQALDKKDLENYFERSGLKPVHLWGNYALDPFDEEHSERLILAGIKK